MIQDDEALTGQLRRGMAVSRDLMAVLREERLALLDQSPESIESVLVRKTALAEDLRSVLAGLQRWRRARGGMAPGRDATLRGVVRARTPGQEPLLSRFCSVLDECRSLEKDNGAIVNQHLRRLNSGIADILRTSRMLIDDCYSPEPMPARARASSTHWVA
ncbi:MAG TPA: hypothetical protein ENK26_02610 [Gammaproteobacteria bacterium]|nr:hypothetical protein [Gammaproteobacteria bacterium]